DEGAHARRVEPVVELRDPQELQAQRRPASVTRQQCEPGCEPAARRLAEYADAAAIDAELVGLLVQPAQCLIAVFDTGREGVLGRETIFNRNDHDPELAGELRGTR